MSVEHLHFNKIIQACVTTHLFQHVSWDIPKLRIAAAQQRCTKLSEAYTASFYCPLVKRNIFFKKEHKNKVLLT